MNRYPNRIEDLPARYIEGLKRALDIDQKIFAAAVPKTDSTTDKQLVEEFRSYMRQTECNLDRIEGLLRLPAGRAA